MNRHADTWHGIHESVMADLRRSHYVNAALGLTDGKEPFAIRVIQILSWGNGDPEALDVVYVEGEGGKDYFLVRTRWLIDIDAKSMWTKSDFEKFLIQYRPGIDMSHGRIEATTVERALACLGKVRVPLYAPVQEIINGGSRWEFCVGEGRVGADADTIARFCWCTSPPDAWSPIETIADDLLRTFRCVLAD